MESIHTIDKLDRPGLEISQNGRELTISETEIEKSKVINLWNSDTIPGKILRVLYNENDEIQISDLKARINYTKNIKSFMSSIANGRGTETQYANFWNARADKIIINPIVRSIILSYVTNNV